MSPGRKKTYLIHKHSFQELLHWMLCLSEWVSWKQNVKNESFSSVFWYKSKNLSQHTNSSMPNNKIELPYLDRECSIHKIKSKILMELADSNWIQLDANVYKMHHTKMICIPYTDQNHCKKLLINKIPSEWK